MFEGFPNEKSSEVLRDELESALINNRAGRVKSLIAEILDSDHLSKRSKIAALKAGDSTTGSGLAWALRMGRTDAVLAYTEAILAAPSLSYEETKDLLIARTSKVATQREYSNIPGLQAAEQAGRIDTAEEFIETINESLYLTDAQRIALLAGCGVAQLVTTLQSAAARVSPMHTADVSDKVSTASADTGEAISRVGSDNSIATEQRERSTSQVALVFANPSNQSTSAKDNDNSWIRYVGRR